MNLKKKEIMQTACYALQKGGVNGFSFRDLAESVGIKSSSVHYHFRNKNELFKAIIIDFRESLSERLVKLSEESDSLQEVLLALIDIFEGVLDEGKFCVCGMLAADMMHLDKEVTEELKATFRALENWLQDTIERLGTKDIPIDSLALIFISSLEGAMLVDRISGEKNYFSAIRAMVKSLT
ncbi:MAG: TetR/AcrR family transcriptional regulator [Lentisphaeraceae bacterium]|nr:TetR/AcrR family transcriptional regulator [Lentisphaeraceae bacterium]